MSLLELVILSIGLAMDAFAVSICKGLAMKSINMRKASVCGVWFGTFQAVMPIIGYFAGVRFASYIVEFDHWIAFVLLLAIGGNMIREALFSDENEADDCGYDFLVKNGRTPWGMVMAFEKFLDLESGSGQKSSYVAKMFSSHPETKARIERMTKRCNKDGIERPESE